MSPAIRPAGNPQGFQSWHTMLFLHWPVPEDALRQLVPAELELDFYDDTAYLSLVLFGMQGVRHRCWPRPLCFQFLEANVRTYVHRKGVPGIYFFSLDATSRLAVRGARMSWSLPYYHARMNMTCTEEETCFELQRRRSDVRHHVRYRVGDVLGASQPDTLDHFLLERYWLFVPHAGRICKAQVHHEPYVAQHAELLSLEDRLGVAAGLNPWDSRPSLAHFVKQVDVEVFKLRPD